MARSQDTQHISQDLLYPLDDPNQAFTNALQDIGINPYRSNPFVEAMKRTAQGSRISYLAQRAFDPARGPVASVASTPSQGYGEFLRGRLGTGDLTTYLAGHSDPTNYATILDRTRQFQDQIAAGTQPATEMNPYMAALSEILNADNGRGALAAYGSLRAPLMGSLGSAYTRSLADFGDSAMRRFAQEGDMRSDPWNWLFRRGGGSSAF